MTISDSENRRNKLVRAASRLFREKGYDGTTVRDIARAVGLQSGSLFYHFRNKEEILVAVMLNGMRRTSEAAENALARHSEPGERLQALFRAHLETLLGDLQDDMIVLLYEQRSMPAEAREHLITMRDAYERVWQEVIEAAVTAGVVDGDAALIRRFSLGALNWTVQWYRKDGPLSPTELADQFLRTLTGPARIPVT